MKPRRFLSKALWTQEEKATFFDRQLYGRPLTGEQMNVLLKEHFEPWIKTKGFKGFKNNYRKIETNGLIKTISLFKDNSGGQLSVNLGIHTDFLPVIGLDIKPVNKINEIDCFIRQPLLKDEDAWFVYGECIEEGTETTNFIKTEIETSGFAFFDRFNNYPKCFLDITVNDIQVNSDNIKHLNINNKWFWHLAYIASINNKFENAENGREIICYAETIIEKQDFKDLVQPIIHRLTQGDSYPSFKIDEK